MFISQKLSKCTTDIARAPVAEETVDRVRDIAISPWRGAFSSDSQVPKKDSMHLFLDPGFEKITSPVNSQVIARF